MSTCEQKTFTGSWLVDDELKTCLLKLKPPVTGWRKGDSHLENVELLKKVLCPIPGQTQSLLKTKFQNRQGLVITPELAFGPNDFLPVKETIEAHDGDLILLSGFGLATGIQLNHMVGLPGVSGIWSENFIDVDAKYNCGWCWIKIGGSLECIIYLKNYVQQSVEQAVPGIAEGDKILRLQFSDLVIYPLICADLIKELQHSPIDAIRGNLTTNPPTMGQRVLVAGSLFEKTPHNARWQSSFGRLLRQSQIRLVTCNGFSSIPDPDEEKDKWRCLSGVFLWRTEMNSGPLTPFSFARFVQSVDISGLLARCLDVGLITGIVSWTTDAATRKNPWSPNAQYDLVSDDLTLHDEFYAADELTRFVLRYKGKIATAAGYLAEGKKISEDSILHLCNLLQPTGERLRAKAETLIGRCVFGVRHGDNKVFVDNLYQADTPEALENALTVLMIIGSLASHDFMDDQSEIEYGQLSKGLDEILVWRGSEAAATIYSALQQLAVNEGGSHKALTVFGKGNNAGTCPPAGKVVSGSTTTITEPNKDQHIITEPSDRVIFWKPMASIDDLLSTENDKKNIEDAIKAQIGSLK